jgi:cytidine deaminase
MIMERKAYRFDFDVYNSVDELSAADAALLKQARATTASAYAPYSHFQVGAVAKLVNGAIVTGTNQENASYPVGICAERVLLSTAAVLHPDIAIDTLAISYHNLNGISNKPVSPCGMCRQSLSEYQIRVGQPMRLILSGMEGKVYVIDKADALLPFSFTPDDL